MCQTYCEAKRELELAEKEDSTNSFSDSFTGGGAREAAAVAEENPQLVVKMTKRTCKEALVNGRRPE